MGMHRGAGVHNLITGISSACITEPCPCWREEKGSPKHWKEVVGCIQERAAMS